MTVGKLNNIEVKKLGGVLLGWGKEAEALVRKEVPTKMVAENENVASITKASGAPVSRNLRPRTKLTTRTPTSDGFYEKLCKVNESTGLSLIFNFRDASLDLHQLYKNVTERGGYNQVIRDGSWEEVASAVNLKSKVPMSPTQLQKLYASLLYQFEQTYHYRTPGKPTEDPSKQDAPKGNSPGIEDPLTCSPGKRKYCNLSEPHSSSSDSPSKKMECTNNPGQKSTVPSREEPKLIMQLPLKEKEMKKDPYTPLGPRTGYQIFVKIECGRLKRVHRESSSGQIRDMAIEAWKKLSEDDKKPYLKASQKDKERYIREMAAYHQCKIQKHATVQNMSSSTKPIFLDFAVASEKDEDYQYMIAELDRRNNCHNKSSSTNQKLLDFALSSENDEDYQYVMSELDAAENNCQSMSSSTKQKFIDFGKPLQTDDDYHETLQKCRITKQKVIDLGKQPEETDGDYHVRLEPDAETTYVSDESMVELAIGMMKNARPNDPIFQMNWDEYSESLGIPR